MGFFDFLFGGKSTPTPQPSALVVRYDKDNVYDVVTALTMLAMRVGDALIMIPYKPATDCPSIYATIRNRFPSELSAKIKAGGKLNDMSSYRMLMLPDDIAQLLASIPFTEERTDDSTKLRYEFTNYTERPYDYKECVISAIQEGRALSPFSQRFNITVNPNFIICDID